MCDSLKFFVMKKKVIFNVNINSRISFVPRYGMAKQPSRLSNSIKFSRILKFSIDKKKSGFIEFKVYLIHKKWVPLFITQYDLC